MKRTKNLLAILLIAVAIAVVGAIAVSAGVKYLGSSVMYMIATALIPIVFAWILVLDQKKADKLFEERERQWRYNSDLSHRHKR